MGKTALIKAMAAGCGVTLGINIDSIMRSNPTQRAVAERTNNTDSTTVQVSVLAMALVPPSARLDLHVHRVCRTTWAPSCPLEVGLGFHR